MKIKRMIKFNLLRLLRIKSEPKNIALGFTIGFIPNWFPTFGFGPLLSVFLAKIFKSNLISAFIGGISGTLTWPFLFFFNYKVGRFLLRIVTNFTDIDEKEIKSIKFFYYKTRMLGLEFFIGSIINSIFFSIILYFLTYIIFTKYRALYLRLIRKS